MRTVHSLSLAFVVVCVMGTASADAQIFRPRPNRPQPAPQPAPNVQPVQPVVNVEPAQQLPAIKGDLLLLSEVTTFHDGQPLRVNRAGLIVAIVRDSGSRQPKNIKVDGGQHFKQLGVARGSQNEDGENFIGGGYTWYLLQPITTGTHTVQVSYRENDDSNTPVVKAYSIEVTR